MEDRKWYIAIFGIILTILIEVSLIINALPKRSGTTTQTPKPTSSPKIITPSPKPYAIYTKPTTRYTNSSSAYGTDRYSYYGYKPDYIKPTKGHWWIEGYGGRQGSYAEKMALGGDDLFRCLECHHIYPRKVKKVWYCPVCYDKLHPDK